MSGRKKEELILPRVSDFYPQLFERSWLLFLFVEIGVVAVVIGTFSIAVNLSNVGVALIASVVCLVLLQSMVGYLLLKHILKPVDMITRALAGISGEATTLTSPDRNSPEFQKSGLSVVLDSIYALRNSAPAAAQPVKNDLQMNLLAALPVGLIALDSNRKIIAKNSLAPTNSDKDGILCVQLDFSSASDSLEQWLDMVTESQISAHKIWSRIPNVSPDSTTERKVFDIIAHYKKNAPSGIETIIAAVDRTEEYSDEEINLDFIALAAHELRGPITVIRGYLDILDEQLASQLNPEQHELIERLDVSAKRLASYVNNILNASRYDRQHLQLTLRETSVEEIVDDIKADMELRAKTLNRQLIWQVPHSLPTVAADQSSISEVISNLIDNAIKYSHEAGSVEIVIQPDDQFVSISVKDHGIGIPANLAGNLFSKFYRSHRSRGVVSGTGLGLYISRAIVESHGGNIEVESTEGEGSTFTFTLPTFASVADKLDAGSSNSDLIRRGGNWIRNHSRVKK